MGLFGSERGIGRGEVAESRIEAPIFAFFMLFCSLLLFAQHLYIGNGSITAALAISLVVFGTTVVRVEFGLYILVIAMLLSPEIDAGDQVSGERRLNLRYDDLLIIVIFMGVMVKLAFDGRLTLWQPSPINWGIIAYFGVCIVATLLAWERALGAWDARTALFTMLKMLQYYLLFWLVGQTVRTHKDVRTLLVLFFSTALVVSCYAIYSIGTLPRVSAPFEQGGTEPNTLGGYLVICITVALGLLTQAPRWRERFLLIAIIGMCAFPMLYTLSRASYIAAIVSAVVVAIVSRRFLLLGLLAVLLLISPFIAPDAVRERVLYTFNEGGEQVVIGGRETSIVVDKSTNERILVWRKVRYLLGVAPVFALFGGGVSWESVLDSQYARVILETGLVGLAAFLFLQFMLLRSTREAYRWTEDWVGRGLAMGMFAATLGLIAHSTGTISFLIVRIMQPYWLLIAMTVFIRNDAIALHTARALARRPTTPKAVATPKHAPQTARRRYVS
jgi:O-antigen ligase